jgi:hypothetical protein
MVHQCPHGALKPKHGVPMPTHGAPMSTHDAPMLTNGAPVSSHGAPMLTDGTPMHLNVAPMPHMVKQCEYVMHHFHPIVPRDTYTKLNINKYIYKASTRKTNFHVERQRVRYFLSFLK